MEQVYRIEGVSLIVQMPAELDHPNSERLKKETDHYLEHYHIQHIIFDFRNTDFMDSSGIGVVAGRYRQLHLRGGSMEAVHVSERIDKILHLSGMHKIMEIHREEKRDEQ